MREMRHGISEAQGGTCSCDGKSFPSSSLGLRSPGKWWLLLFPHYQCSIFGLGNS